MYFNQYSNRIFSLNRKFSNIKPKLHKMNENICERKSSEKSFRLIARFSFIKLSF